jgi:hypothetical protein
LDCWQSRLLLRTSSPPDEPHAVVTWDGEAAYSVTLPNENPESAKLLALADAVEKGGTTLPSAAFAMRLILKALEIRSGSIPIPRTEVTSPAPSGSIDLDLGDGYL